MRWNQGGREKEREIERDRGREGDSETRVRRGWIAWTCFSPDSPPSADPLAPVVFLRKSGRGGSEV